MKEWKAPEVLDLKIALTAGGVTQRSGAGNANHSTHILPTAIPTIAPFEDESNITL